MKNKLVKVIVIVVSILFVFKLIQMSSQTVDVHNKLINYEVTYHNQDKLIKLQQDKKMNLLPSLYKLTYEYVKHENDVLTTISENVSTMSKTDMESRYPILLSYIQKYPELHANAQIMDMKNRLTDIENDIIKYQKLKISILNSYEVTKNTFPGNMYNSLFFNFKELE